MYDLVSERTMVFANEGQHQPGHDKEKGHREEDAPLK